MWEEHDVGKAAHLMTPSKEGKKKENGREQEGTKRKGEKKM